MLVAAALVAVISGADIVGHAAGAPGQLGSTNPGVAARALEPGFSGTFLYRNDNFRTGQNLAESVLTPSTVNDQQFGLLFTDAIDAAAYAQPLYVPAVQIPNQGTHNVVYVATENDSVYAFDADQPGDPLWHTSFIDPANGITPVPATDLGCSDLVPIIGITATPVIDPTTGTLYVVSKVKLGPGSYQQQLHALDITTGLKKRNSPVTITASVPGTASDAVNGVISFNPLLQHDRPALAIANGVVYLSFASHCDIGLYHGWILGYDETTLAQEVVYNTTPNGDAGGIWQAGCGPGIDTNGDLITITGNGTFDTGTATVDYGDSFLRLTPGGGTMSVTSSFTPLNELLLDDDDLDMGSGGNLLLPDQPGPNPHLMVGAGKVGTLYLVNRDNMGGFNATKDPTVQALPSAVGGMFSTPAYWQGIVPNVGLQNMVYTVGEGDKPKMFALSNGLIQTPPASTAVHTFPFPGASPVISANGTTGGIMWAIDSSAWSSGGTAILYAFDATNLHNELYDSDQFSADNPGPAVKFTVPTVANGSVYMGTQTQLAAFGLFASPRPTPTATATATVIPPTATPTATATLTVTPTATATPHYATIARETNGTSTGFTDSLGTSTTFSLGSGVQNNDLVLLEAIITNKEPVSAPTGFTLVSSNQSDYFQIAVFEEVWQTGDPTTGIPLSWTGNAFVTWATKAYVNADTTPVLVSAVSSNVASNLCSFPGITPSTSIDMLVMICGNNDGGSITGFSEGSVNVQYVSDEEWGIGDGDYLLDSSNSTGNQTASLSSGASNTDWESVSISIKPAVTSTPVPSATATAAATVTATITVTPSATATATAITSPTVTVTQTATSTPTATATPTTTMSATASLAFGNVAVGDTVTRNLTIKNTGAIHPLIVSNAIPSDSEYSLSGTGTCGAIPISIAPKTNCTLGVSFTPNAIGAHSATLMILDNATSSPQRLTLSGTGIADMSLSKTSLAFGSVKFSVKPVQSFGVTNHQRQPVSLSESFSGTNAADFSITGGTCKTTLAASSACSITVAFTPSALGTESATLTVSDSPDPLGPCTVAISTGPTIPATVTPGSLAYGTLKTTTKTLNATVTNLSPFSLPLSESFNGANAGDFAVTGGTCGTTALPNSHCTIAVKFTPTAGGAPESASMLVSIGNDPASPQKISLTGTGP